MGEDRAIEPDATGMTGKRRTVLWVSCDRPPRRELAAHNTPARRVSRQAGARRPFTYATAACISLLSIHDLRMYLIVGNNGSIRPQKEGSEDDRSGLRQQARQDVFPEIRGSGGCVGCTRQMGQSRAHLDPRLEIQRPGVPREPEKGHDPRAEIISKLEGYPGAGRSGRVHHPRAAHPRRHQRLRRKGDTGRRHHFLGIPGGRRRGYRPGAGDSGCCAGRRCPLHRAQHHGNRLGAPQLRVPARSHRAWTGRPGRHFPERQPRVAAHQVDRAQAGRPCHVCGHGQRDHAQDL